MAKNEIKNYGKSNRTKLLNLSKQTRCVRGLVSDVNDGRRLKAEA